MNQLSYYVTKRLIVGSKDSSGTIIHKFIKLFFLPQQIQFFQQRKFNSIE